MSIKSDKTANRWNVLTGVCVFQVLAKVFAHFLQISFISPGIYNR